MSASADEIEISNAGKIDQQYRFLPPAWRAVDRYVMRATETFLFVVGALFTVMVTLEVVSRYALNFSIMYVNSGSRFLLVWFFVIGAGPALRYGAHVGFELLIGALAPRRRRAFVLAAQFLALAFFAEMVWAGYYSLGPAWRQIEPGLEISLLWAFLSIPVGFALLIYHMGVLIAVELARVPADGRRP